MKYAIVIPAYKEEQRLEATVRDYAAFIQSEMDTTQTLLWIVVNGTGDRTGDIANALAEEYDFVKAWVTDARMGKGGAVMKGFELAQAEIVAFTDADNATVAPELKKLLNAVEQKAVDAAIGSRWLPESEQTVPQPFARRLASRVFNLMVRTMFFFPYTDTQCGAKAFRKEAIEAVRDEVKVTGWTFDVALIWRLRKKGFKVVEVPIVWCDMSKSRLRLHTDGPAMVWELLKLRLFG